MDWAALDDVRNWRSVTNSASVHSTVSQHVRIFQLTVNDRPQANI